MHHRRESALVTLSTDDDPTSVILADASNSAPEESTDTAVNILRADLQYSVLEGGHNTAVLKGGNTAVVDTLIDSSDSVLSTKESAPFHDVLADTSSLVSGEDTGTTSVGVDANESSSVLCEKIDTAVVDVDADARPLKLDGDKDTIIVDAADAATSNSTHQPEGSKNSTVDVVGGEISSIGAVTTPTATTSLNLSPEEIMVERAVREMVHA